MEKFEESAKIPAEEIKKLEKAIESAGFERPEAAGAAARALLAEDFVSREDILCARAKRLSAPRSYEAFAIQEISELRERCRRLEEQNAVLKVRVKQAVDLRLPGSETVEGLYSAFLIDGIEKRLADRAAELDAALAAHEAYLAFSEACENEPTEARTVKTPQGQEVIEKSLGGGARVVMLASSEPSGTPEASEQAQAKKPEQETLRRLKDALEEIEALKTELDFCHQEKKWLFGELRAKEALCPGNSKTVLMILEYCKRLQDIFHVTKSDGGAYEINVAGDLLDGRAAELTFERAEKIQAYWEALEVMFGEDKIYIPREGDGTAGESAEPKEGEYVSKKDIEAAREKAESAYGAARAAAAARGEGEYRDGAGGFDSRRTVKSNLDAFIEDLNKIDEDSADSVDDVDNMDTVGSVDINSINNKENVENMEDVDNTSGVIDVKRTRRDYSCDIIGVLRDAEAVIAAGAEASEALEIGAELGDRWRLEQKERFGKIFKPLSFEDEDEDECSGDQEEELCECSSPSEIDSPSEAEGSSEAQGEGVDEAGEDLGAIFSGNPFSKSYLYETGNEEPEAPKAQQGGVYTGNRDKNMDKDTDKDNKEKE